MPDKPRRAHLVPRCYKVKDYQSPHAYWIEYRNETGRWRWYITLRPGGDTDWNDAWVDGFPYPEVALLVLQEYMDARWPVPFDPDNDTPP